MLFIGGCIQQNSRPVSDAPSVIQARQASPIISNNSEPQSYRLQIRDKLDIRFFYNNELDQRAVIRPDGKITLQLINEVQAVGITPADLQQKLVERYTGILRRPEVTVIVTEFSSPKAYIAGEVEQPGQIDITPTMNVLQAIIQRGGFTPDAERGNVIIIRNRDQSQPEFIALDLYSFLNQGKLQYPQYSTSESASASLLPDQASPDNSPVVSGNLIKNLQIEPFDIVYIPQTRIASVAEFFDRYVNNILPIYKNMGLTLFYDLSPVTSVRVADP